MNTQKQQGLLGDLAAPVNWLHVLHQDTFVAGSCIHWVDTAANLKVLLFVLTLQALQIHYALALLVLGQTGSMTHLG